MMRLDQTEAFLFPFERVPQGSRIVIYGAGVKGQSYLRQMLMTGYCTVVALADKNYEGYKSCVVPVCAPEKIHTFDFDYVVIALRFAYHLQVFQEVLRAQGVSPSRIVYQSARESVPIFSEKDARESSRNAHAILLYFMGGIGDNIVQKKVVETLISLAPDSPIDVYSTQNETFLNYLYRDTPQVRKIAWNLGTRFDEEKDQYAAALQFTMLRWIEVAILREERLPRRLGDVLHRLKGRSDKEKHTLDWPMSPVFSQCFFKGESCYQYLSYDGILPIEGHRIQMPSNKEEKAFQKLGLASAYVTVNFGNGESKEIHAISKAWPQERFEQVIAGIHKNRPDVEIVQLGAAGAVCLAGADHVFLGKDFPLVSAVLRHSLLHIDIEGGLVHLATQLGTKCLVLFGPTPLWFYGYPENINLQAGDCHACYGAYSDWNRCARDLKEPECMYRITAEQVLEKALAYLEQKV